MFRFALIVMDEAILIWSIHCNSFTKEKHIMFRFIATIILEGNMEDTISLFDIFNTLKKRWKLIVLITLAAALISGTISYFVLTPVYQASTQILVNQKNTENQLDISQINSNVDLINTYSVIIKSPAILDKVIDKLDLTQNVEQLNQNIIC